MFSAVYSFYSPLEQFNFHCGYSHDTDGFGKWRSTFFLDNLFLPTFVPFTADMVSTLGAWHVVQGIAGEYLGAPIHRSLYQAGSVLATMYIVPLSLIIGVPVFLFSSLRPTRRLVRSGWDRAADALVTCVHTLLRDNVGFAHYKYFNGIFVVFALVFFSNVFGLVPFFFTLTSHFAVTLALSTTFSVGFNLLAIRRHGLKFLTLFIPSGAPAGIRPFLVFIEAISYFARVFSLSIRLFANMTAGHTLIKILAGYGYVMISSLGLWFFTGLLVFGLLLVIIVLEVFIAALQAYVFAMLLCIYLNDVLALDAH